MTSMNKRNFLKMAGLSTLGLGTTGMNIHEANAQPKNTSKMTKENLTILFQGDSITDAGRNRGDYYANHGSGLGNGYVHQVCTELLGKHPNKNLRCYNRGISGNKIFQLAERWQDDCLNLRPDVLSILIGVNDFWHTLDLGYEGTVETYSFDFRKLLERTKDALPDVKLIIGEPFVVKGGSSIDEKKWSPAFDGYRKAAEQIAKDYDAVWIPYQKIFATALDDAPASYWCPDGVHPSLAGNYLMAQAWQAAFDTLFK